VNWILTVAALAASAAPADEGGALTVQMQGTAPGVGRSARAAAIENAQTAILIDRLIAISGNPDLRRFGTILDNPSRYFRYYRLLQQSTQSESSTTVVIEAAVLDAVLRRDTAAQLIPHLPDKPRILLIVPERLDPKLPFELPEHPVAYAALSKSLAQAGCEVLATDELREKRSGEELAFFAAGEPEPVSQFARLNLADIVIVGNASVSSEVRPQTSELRPYRAEMSLSIVRAGDATILAELTAEAVVFSIDPMEGAAQAIRDACAKLREPLTVETVLGSLTRTPSEHIVLSVRGDGIRSKLPEIRGRLENHENVEQVEILSVTENAAWFRVVGSVPVKQLTETATRGAYSDFRLKLQAILDKDILLALETTPVGE
jgi:hypothetical protein